jgi:hypothetical protein
MQTVTIAVLPAGKIAEPDSGSDAAVDPSSAAPKKRCGPLRFLRHDARIDLQARVKVVTVEE